MAITGCSAIVVSESGHAFMKHHSTIPGERIFLFVTERQRLGSQEVLGDDQTAEDLIREMLAERMLHVRTLQSLMRSKHDQYLVEVPQSDHNSSHSPMQSLVQQSPLPKH